MNYRKWYSLKNRITGLSIDIGGTKTSFSIFEKGKVTRNWKVTTSGRDMKSISDLLVKTINDLFSEFEYEQVAICVPGVASKEGSVVFAPNIPGSKDFRLSDQIFKGTGSLPTVIDDRTALVIGESISFKSENIVALSIGTGIGAGIMLDGHVINVDRPLAGSIGWSPAFLNISSDKNVNLEGVASGKIYRNILEFLPNGMLQDDTNQQEILDFTKLFTLFDRGDNSAAIIINSIKQNLWRYIAVLLNLLSPEFVVLNGSVGLEIGKRFIKDLKTDVMPFVIPLIRTDINICVSQAGNVAFPLGALAFSLVKKN